LTFDSRLRKELGSYLKSCRHKTKLTQISCAKTVKVSAQFLGAVEKGKVPCPQHVLQELIPLLDLKKIKVLQIFERGVNRQIDKWFRI